MPSVSAPQQHLMGAALAYKRGELPHASPEVKRLAHSMSESQLRDFAATKGLARGGAPLAAAEKTPKLTLTKMPTISPSEGTPWWTRHEAMGMGKRFADGGMACGLGDRPHRQIGGGSMSEEAPWWERSTASEIMHPSSGFLNSSIAGRTDRLPLAVPSESFVFPADVVSGLGQGNSLAGANVLHAILKTGPLKVPMPQMHPTHLRAPPTLSLRSMPHDAEGGAEHKPVSIVAAGGEFIADPDAVRRLGRGSYEKGHRHCEEIVRRVREHTKQWLKRAPPPKK